MRLTYGFNVTFTRADEDHAIEYVYGTQVDSERHKADAERILHGRFSQTIVRTDLVYVTNEDGDFVWEAK